MQNVCESFHAVAKERRSFLRKYKKIIDVIFMQTAQ